MATLYSLPLILYLYSFIMCECLIAIGMNYWEGS